jgi:hypothetical protein
MTKYMLLLVILLVPISNAHEGEMDENGCHEEEGIRHCH